MVRYDFGGTLADFVVTPRRLGGLDVLGLSAATLTFWSAQTGGTRYTDLQLNGSAMSSISVGADGQVPTFQGPDAITAMWADGGAGRTRIVAQGIPGPAGPGATNADVAGYFGAPGATQTAADARYAAGGALSSTLAAGTADGQTALCSGRYARSDGGEGAFVWAERGTKAHDGGVVIVPAGYGGTKGWQRVEASKGSINPKWWGLIADGTSNPLSERFGSLAAAQAAFPSIPDIALTDENDWAAIQSAVNAAQSFQKVIIPAGAGGADLRLNRTINLFDKSWFTFAGEQMTILRMQDANNDIPILRMGGTTEKTQNIANLYLTRGTLTSNAGGVGISIRNLNHSNWNDVWIWNCYDGIRQDGDVDSTAGRNVFYSNHITGLRVRNWAGWAVYLKSGVVESTQNFFYDAYFSVGGDLYDATNPTLLSTPVRGSVCTIKTDLVFAGVNFEHTLADTAMLYVSASRVEISKAHVEFVDAYRSDDNSITAALFKLVSGGQVRAGQVEQEYTALQKTVGGLAATSRYLAHIFNGGRLEIGILHTNSLRAQTTGGTWVEADDATSAIAMRVYKAEGTGSATVKIGQRARGATRITGSYYNFAITGADPISALEEFSWGTSRKERIQTTNPGTDLLWSDGGIVKVGTGIGWDISKPTGTKRTNMPRMLASATTVGGLSTGRLLLAAIWLAAGDVVTSISACSGATAAATPTNQWFALYSGALAKLAVTGDDTTAPWAATTVKTLNLTTPFSVNSGGLYYVGIMVAAATVPTLTGAAGTTALTGLSPLLSIVSTTGLTDPTSAPASAASAGSANGVPYISVQ